MEQTNTEPGTLVTRRVTLGALGESLAAEYLESRGCRILGRNWRNGREGELDLIVQDGDCTVAVEVKTRSGTGYGHPLEAITARKASRLRRLLLSWVKESHPRTERLRVDGIGITLCAGELPRIDHLEGIG